MATMILIGCTSLSDQKSAKDLLSSRKPVFENINQALKQLKCVDHDLNEKPMLLEFNQDDKILQLETSQSYVKKICLRAGTQQITVAGKHVGGGNSKAFYALPGYFAYSSEKKVAGVFDFAKAFMSGNLLFSFNSIEKFDTVLVFLDTVDLEAPFKSDSTTVYAGGPAIAARVRIYKYPTGKIEISLSK